MVFSDRVMANPSAYTQFMVAVDFAVGPTFSLVVAGDSNSDDTKELIEEIQNHYLPNKIFIFRPTDQSPPEIDEYAKFINSFTKSENKATAYVCIDKTCLPATNEKEEVIKLLTAHWNKPS